MSPCGFVEVASHPPRQPNQTSKPDLEIAKIVFGQFTINIINARLGEFQTILPR